MKKGNFAIYVRRDGELIPEMVSGYILDYGAFRFGVRKQYNQWSVTEISTGMLTGIYTNRKRDIIPTLWEKPELLEQIQKKINDHTDLFIETAKERIREFYTA